MGYDKAAAGMPLRTRTGEEFVYNDAVQNLADAMADLATFVTPASARMLQTTENLWRRIEFEDGLLTGDAVVELLGLSDRALVCSLRMSGRLIGVVRRKGVLFPGFQFDPGTHQIRSVIQPLLRIADVNDYSPTGLTMWMYTPTTYFEDERRPVDHLEPAAQLLQVASDAMGVEW